MRYLLRILFLLVILTAPSAASTKTYMKRSRGRGMYHNEGANTIGRGNVWVDTRAIGFIWDDTFDTLTGVSEPAIHGFLETRIDAGLFNFLSLLLESRVVSYPWDGRLQFGNLQAGFKATVPNNKDIRLVGVGLEIRYLHSFLKNFNSIAGYRKGGTGFSPEGIIVEGGSLQAKLLYDLDLIANNSKFPIRVMLNAGLRIPFDDQNKDLSQYLFSLGVSYSGLEFEGFAEYSVEALVNSIFLPQKISRDWWISNKTWEVALSENPMYITLGGRYHAANGLTGMVCVPLLVSTNHGTAMTQEDKINLHRNPGQYTDIKDTFDPWYAKWKIIMQVSVPIRYSHTAAEMRRNFLLLKNRKEDDKLDIDRRLQDSPSDNHMNRDDQDTQKRLEEIRKRRKKIEQTE